MTIVTCIGVDPGQVHTAIVVSTFEWSESGPTAVTMTSQPFLFDGLDADFHAEVIESMRTEHTYIFVEQFRDRGQGYTNASKMLKYETLLCRKVRDAVLVNNSGVKKLVTPALLKKLGLHRFTSGSNHQDLQSAARIMLLGMMKQDARSVTEAVPHDLNNLLFRITAPLPQGPIRTKPVIDNTQE